MVIEKLPQRQREGYPINEQALSLELYRLLCYFVASPELGEENFEAPFSNLLDEYQREQILITLITIASTVLIIDDREENYLNSHDTNCGKLYIIKSNNTRTNNILNLREACNKIIHAQRVKFELFNAANRRKLKTKIHLYGTYNRKKWKATIDIIKFSELINQLVFC